MPAYILLQTNKHGFSLLLAYDLMARNNRLMGINVICPKINYQNKKIYTNAGYIFLLAKASEACLLR